MKEKFIKIMGMDCVQSVLYEHNDQYEQSMRKVGSSVLTFHKPLSDFKGLHTAIAGIAYHVHKWNMVLFLLHCVRMWISCKLSTYTI